MKTILHIAHAFCPDRSGTAERIYNTQPLGDFRHIILKPSHANDVYEFEAFLVVCVVLPHRKKSRWKTLRNAQFLAKEALKLIDEYCVDILYGHNPLLCSLAALEVIDRNKAIKLVYEPHNLLYSHFEKRVKEGKTSFSRWLLSLYHSNLVQIERALFQRAEVIISQTGSLAQKIQEIYSVENSKICVAYNGLPEVEVHQSASLGLPEEKFLVYGGDLSRNNGLHLILSLVENYPEIQVVIAGSGAYAEKLELAAKKHKNLRFLGSLDKQSYLTVLHLAEALLILRESNLTNDNYLPLKLLDAISLGKKVITTDIYIMREMQQTYPLISFTELNVREIANVAKRTLSSNDQLVCDQAIKRPEMLSWQVSRDLIEDAVRKLA